jgi:hydrogenase expression/formation protein HypD
MLVEAIEDESATAGNQYTRTVRPEGNLEARRRMQEVFETCDMTWRGVGRLPASGLRLREAYAAFDAERRFAVERLSAEESPDCIAGAVLKGKAKPSECTAFGRDCTPERPLGAPMVSTEGACAAYFAFRKAGGDG